MFYWIQCNIISNDSFNVVPVETNSQDICSNQTESTMWSSVLELISPQSR